MCCLNRQQRCGEAWLTHSCRYTVQSRRELEVLMATNSVVTRTARWVRPLSRIVLNDMEWIECLVRRDVAGTQVMCFTLVVSSKFYIHEPKFKSHIYHFSTNKQFLFRHGMQELNLLSPGTTFPIGLQPFSLALYNYLKFSLPSHHLGFLSFVGPKRQQYTHVLSIKIRYTSFINRFVLYKYQSTI